MPDDDATFSIDVKIQRGTGTDDRDTLKATVKADTLDELDERENQMLERLDDLAQRVRSIQPDDTTAKRIAEGQTTLAGDDVDQEAD